MSNAPSPVSGAVRSVVVDGRFETPALEPGAVTCPCAPAELFDDDAVVFAVLAAPIAFMALGAVTEPCALVAAFAIALARALLAAALAIALARALCAAALFAGL